MIRITVQQRDEIINQALAAGGQEACGILAGRGEKVERVYQMRNTSDTPVNCYFMDPAEQLKVMKEIRSAGLEMTGIYHTHPASEAYPSARDVELAFYPDTVYVLISLLDKSNPSVRAFQIVAGKVSEQAIKVERE